MDVAFDPEWARGYKSRSQIARVLTETWTKSHMYCPVCGWPSVEKFPNNRAAADFYCPHCKNEYEKKSKAGTFGSTIPDGAYDTFIQRISSNNNPDFFIMQYSLAKMRVEELYLVPKYFFVPSIVEQRKALGPNAQRAGWVGCNIRFDRIPAQGRIPIILGGVPLEKTLVLAQVQRAEKIQTRSLEARGWLLDVLQRVNQMDEFFTLDQMYLFESELAQKHPDNHNVRAKIRQQPQRLRDGGEILFLGGGQYQKVKHPLSQQQNR